MANNHSAPAPQKITCLSAAQCTTDFTSVLAKQSDDDPHWLSLFPIAAEVSQHFSQLATPLMLLNAPYWHTAKVMLESCFKDKQPLLTLQHYDQATLFGRIKQGEAQDFKLLPGQISQCDNGIMVLHISPLLVEPKLWFLLKAFLLTKMIPSNAPVNATKFRGQPDTQLNALLNTKIVIVANRYQLDELTQIDPDYSQISTLFAELPGEIKNTEENVLALRNFCQETLLNGSLLPLSNGAFNTLFIHLSRLCEHQHKLLFSAQLITSILQYAQLMHAQDNNHSTQLASSHIQQVLTMQNRSKSYAQDFSDQALVEKQLRIQLDGKMVGQINGLSVVELMGYPTEFGEIFRISATDMIGDGEIVDVERKVELGGNVHAKGTLIVQGYLNHFFTHIPNFPFSCNVVFEQSYQESDGDSASLAILLAVTSCYSQTEITQNLFVTGALDQHGNVLAIGGINQKIEAITRLFGLGLLNDPVTVLMPQANQVNLLLNEETLALIRANKINIHQIQHSVEAFPFAMSSSFEKVVELINKRILLLHKEDDDEAQSFITKCLNLLR